MHVAPFDDDSPKEFVDNFKERRRKERERNSIVCIYLFYGDRELIARFEYAMMFLIDRPYVFP